MDLTTFFPHQLSTLSEAVGRAVSQVYADRFGLTREEWRILAVLSEPREMKTREALDRSALDKMQVSRAVARLETRGLIEREDDPADRRNKILRLTRTGRDLVRKVEPLVLAREAYLLEALPEADRAALARAFAIVRGRAEDLARRG